MLRDSIKYIKSDYFRYTGRNSSIFRILFFLLYAHNHGFNFQFWLRLAAGHSLLSSFARWKHRQLSVKYNLDIHYTTQIGYGLYLGHAICMVVDRRTIIGNNVNLSQFLNIGSNSEKPAVIKDNVYIGPSVCLVENVNISESSIIGAGSVVLNDTLPYSINAGVPTKMIKIYDPEDKKYDFIKNKYPLN